MIRVLARASLPTRAGDFQIVAFQRALVPTDGLMQPGLEFEHVAMVRGDVTGREGLLVRVHSECLTGDVFGSLRCDCRDQLEMALRLIGERDAGAVLYLRQEGRGIGLGNKIKAYALQEKGMDTVEANRHLGFGDDLRDYDDAAAMLRCLGVRSVVLYTNNPRKIADLERNGVKVVRREPLRPTPNAHNEDYIKVKQRKLGHL